MIVLSQALVLRQLRHVLRRARSLWFLGVALLVITGGFVVEYQSQLLRHAAATGTEELTLGLPLLKAFYQFCLLALMLFVPLIGVNAIAHERDSETLDMLLSTPTRPLTLVISKVVVSITQILFALIGTLPILALTLLMGGVGPFDLALDFLSLLIVTLFTLSVGMWAGAHSQTQVRGIVTVYMVFVAVAVSALCYIALIRGILWIGFRIDPDVGTSIRTFLFIVTHGPLLLLSLVFLSMVPFAMRREMRRVRPRSWRPPRMKGIDTQLWTLLGVRDYGDPIRDGQNPIYVSERERFLSQVVRRTIDAPSLLWLFSATVMAVVTCLSPPSMLAVTLYAVLLFTPAVGATAFSRERELATWDVLCTTLLERKRILSGKLRLCVGQGLIHAAAVYFPALPILGIVWIGIAGGGPGGAGVFSSRNVVPFWGMLALGVPVVVATTVLLANVSVWCSTVFRQSFAATIVSYVLGLLFMLGPAFLASIHPIPGEAIGGVGEADVLSSLIASAHAPYVFNLWPESVRVSARSSRFTEAITSAPLQFWQLYATHIAALCGVSLVLHRDTRRRITSWCH